MCLKLPLRRITLASQRNEPSDNASPSPTNQTLPARRDPNLFTIRNETALTISFKVMRREVASDPPKMELQPGEEKPLPMIPSGTYVRMAMFEHDKNLGLFVDSENVSRDMAIRPDTTKGGYRLEPKDTGSTSNGQPQLPPKGCVAVDVD